MSSVIANLIVIALFGGTIYGASRIVMLFRAGSLGAPDPRSGHIIDASYDALGGQGSARIITHTSDPQAHARAFIPSSSRTKS